MAECIKALSAVVAAHAAAAHAAEAHAAGGPVNNGIVDAAAAEGNGGEHALLQRAVFGKQVQRQRMFAAVHKSERLVDGIIGDDGQNRAEDFLLHDRVAGRDAIQNRRLNAQRLLICPPAENHFVRIDQPADAAEVLFVNHVHIAVAVERVFADHVLDFLLQ